VLLVRGVVFAVAEAVVVEASMLEVVGGEFVVFGKIVVVDGGVVVVL